MAAWTMDPRGLSYVFKQRRGQIAFPRIRKEYNDALSFPFRLGSQFQRRIQRCSGRDPTEDPFLFCQFSGRLQSLGIGNADDLIQNVGTQDFRNEAGTDPL